MKNKIMKMKKAGFLVVGIAASSASYAALPAAAQTALDSIGTGISDAETATWPLIGAALVAGIVIKLTKRFANKV